MRHCLPARSTLVAALALAAVAIVLLAPVMVALASPSGARHYGSGAQRGKTKPGVRLWVKSSRFEIQRISYRERCAGDGHVIKDEFNFSAGPGTALRGKVSRSGSFSARFRSRAGSVRVHGRVHGARATIVASEQSTFRPQRSSVLYRCKGSHTFRAHRR
jgi:hypothetical protein